MKITNAQANALSRLFAQGYQPGDSFNPYDVFPERNAQDNGARRALNSLVAHNVLTRLNRPMGWLQISNYTRRKLEEWVEK